MPTNGRGSGVYEADARTFPALVIHSALVAGVDRPLDPVRTAIHVVPGGGEGAEVRVGEGVACAELTDGVGVTVAEEPTQEPKTLAATASVAIDRMLIGYGSG